MTPRAIPKTLRVYQLIRMTTTAGLNFSAVTTMSTPSLGQGIFLSEAEAEQYRTIEILKNSDGAEFYVFELEFPNPALKK